MSKTRSYAEPSGKPSGHSWDYESPAAKWVGALTSRAAAQSHEVRVRVEDVFDEELDGLRGKVSVLKGVAQEIESETRSQNDHLRQLESSMAKAQAGISNSMKRLNRSLAGKLALNSVSSLQRTSKHGETSDLSRKLPREKFYDLQLY